MTGHTLLSQCEGTKSAQQGKVSQPPVQHPRHYDEPFARKRVPKSSHLQHAGNLAWTGDGWAKTCIVLCGEKPRALDAIVRSATVLRPRGASSLLPRSSTPLSCPPLADRQAASALSAVALSNVRPFAHFSSSPAEHAFTSQKRRGTKAAISSALRTVKYRVGDWHGPNEIKRISPTDSLKVCLAPSRRFLVNSRVLRTRCREWEGSTKQSRGPRWPHAR